MPKLLLVTWLFFVAVRQAQQPAGRASRAAPVTYRAFRKTLTVARPCAVLYSPGAAWIARHKKHDVEGFCTVADDMGFYISQTSDYLAERKIKVVDADADADAAWIRFKRGNPLVKEVDLRRSKYGWGLLLFNGRDVPKEADLVTPGDDVRRVFHK